MIEPWPEALVERVKQIAAICLDGGRKRSDGVVTDNGLIGFAAWAEYEFRAALDASGLREAQQERGMFVAEAQRCQQNWLDVAAERDALQQRNAELVEALERIEKEDQRYIIQDGVYPNELAAGNCSKIARVALARTRGETP